MTTTTTITAEEVGDDDDDEGPGCRAPFTQPHQDRDHKKLRVCRTLQQWAAIGVEKLYDALDARDGGRFANATSLACAAEKLLRLVTDRLPPSFDDGASYRHQTLGPELAAFDLVGGQTSGGEADNATTDLLIGTRTVRSFRRAADAPANTNHTLIATYIVARVLERSLSEISTERAQEGVVELLWPVAGAISAFDKTGLPGDSLCAMADQQTNLQAFDATRALPCLGPLDFATVADHFDRCHEFPSSRLRRYDNLQATSCCSTIVLMADITDKGNGTRFEPRRESLGYVAHYRSRCTFEAIFAAENSTLGNSTAPNNSTSAGNSTLPNNLVFDPHIETDLVARIAAIDLCLDVLATTSIDTNVTASNSTGNGTTGGNTTVAGFAGGLAVWWRAPREGIPITLAPGESRCVGGERPGEQCSVASECGDGRTCRLKPGTTQAFCYDRFAWSESEPCIYANELTECPYGYCYGAVDGHDGGAYPLLHTYRKNRCDSQNAVIVECPPDIMAWFDYPTLDSVQ